MAESSGENFAGDEASPVVTNDQSDFGFRVRENEVEMLCAGMFHTVGHGFLPDTQQMMFDRWTQAPQRAFDGNCGLSRVWRELIDDLLERAAGIRVLQNGGL